MPYKVGDIVECFKEKYQVEGKDNLSQLLSIVRLSDGKRRIAYSTMVYLIEPVKEPEE